jgi:signal peptidase II
MTIKKAYQSTAIITIVLFLADQASKWFADSRLKEGMDLMPFIGLKYHENIGIAWSLPIPYIILLPLNLVLLSLIIFFSLKYLRWDNDRTVIITALVFAGAIGNIYDRVARGAVTDFISIGSWPVFNLADAYLTIGIFLGIVFYGKIKKDH